MLQEHYPIERIERISQMGFFDIFKSKPKAEPDETPQPAASSWAARLKNFRRMEDEEKWALSEALLQDLGTRFDKPKIKKSDDFDDIELRARTGDLPIKIKFDATSGWVSIDMQCDNRTGILVLTWDMDKLPKEKDDDDDWADDDEIRIFVGKGVFVEGDDDDVNRSLTTLQSLPTAFADELVSKMTTMKLTLFTAVPGEISIGFKDDHYEMADPVQEILEGVELMKSAAEAFGAGDRDMSNEPTVQISGNVMINGQMVTPNVSSAPAPQAIQRITCKYCSTVYLLTPASKCPNCGAASSA